MISQTATCEGEFPNLRPKTLQFTTGRIFIDVRCVITDLYPTIDRFPYRQTNVNATSSCEKSTLLNCEQFRPLHVHSTIQTSTNTANYTPRTKADAPLFRSGQASTAPTIIAHTSIESHRAESATDKIKYQKLQ